MSSPRWSWHLRGRVLHFDKPLVMAIVNVTPDSFSDGGRHATTDAAIAHGLALVSQGADLLDIGGESTRPGSLPISLDEELARVVPVVCGLAAVCTVPLSIDTTKAEVARQALDAGAHIINDISALQFDSNMGPVVRDAEAGLILMHIQGTPATMQLDPHYQDVVKEVLEFLEARLQITTNLGIAPERVVFDPGIGFGKTVEHNLRLLAELGELRRLGRPILLGVSRKGFLGKVLNRPLEERLAGSLAAISYALGHDAADMVRVHDVPATRDVVDLHWAIEQAKMKRT